MAKRHNTQSQARLSVDAKAYRLLVETLSAGSTEINELLAATAPLWLASDGYGFSDTPRTLPSAARSLSSTVRVLNGDSASVSTKARTISGQAISLPDEPKGLSEIYRSALFSSRHLT
jgi:hypothetical protein